MLRLVSTLSSDLAFDLESEKNTIFSFEDVLIIVRYEERSVLFPIQRRTMFEPYVNSSDKIKLLLLHGNTGTTHGLGEHVPTLSASEYQRIRRVVPAWRRNDLQRRW